MTDAIAADIRSFIKCNMLFEENDVFSDNQSLIENELVDSTGILELVSFLEERFGITITADELVPDNLDSVERLREFVLRKTTPATDAA